jgi:hypothetical protein
MTGTTLRHPGDPFPRSLSAFPAAGLSICPMTWRAASASSCCPGEARCQYRNAQLGAFQRVLDGLAAVDASIPELPVNDEATTRDTIARHGLRFPVGHSADAAVVADATGAFADPDPPFLQSAGVVLDPGGRAIVSVYSSAAPGRFVPQDVTGLIRYLRGHAPQPV